MSSGSHKSKKSTQRVIENFGTKPCKDAYYTTCIIVHFHIKATFFPCFVAFSNDDWNDPSDTPILHTTT